jgi:hypothetical protein
VKWSAHKGRGIELKDLSYLRWTDTSSDTMVVTFGEVVAGDADSGVVKRQYWVRQGQHPVENIL